MDAAPPLPNKWADFQTQIYKNGHPPVLGTVDMKEIEEKAKEVMKDQLPAYMYTFGSAGTCATEVANQKALDNQKIVPAMLTGSTNRSLETTIFGVKYQTPVFIAPVGVQGIMHADGELASARAAANLDVGFILSTASTRSIEDVAEANGPNGHRWYQLYWPKMLDVTLSLLKRAKENGYTALVITLDTMKLGWRPHDIKTAYLPMISGVGVQVGTSDPVYMKRFGLEPRQHEVTSFPLEPEKVREAAFEKGDQQAKQEMMLGVEWLAEANSGVFRTWEDLKVIRDNWEGPILLKGIQRVSDAEKAIAYGMDGIIVSNHGGRQVDGGIGALDALERVMRSSAVLEAQRSGKLTVFFDSGIRNGSDIIKAMAIGAQAVLIGRPFMYGLAIAGQEGVEQILMQIFSDLHITLGLCGYDDINDIIGKKDELLVKLNYTV